MLVGFVIPLAYQDVRLQKGRRERGETTMEYALATPIPQAEVDPIGAQMAEIEAGLPPVEPGTIGGGQTTRSCGTLLSGSFNPVHN